jgi:hypothetical protein
MIFCYNNLMVSKQTLTLLKYAMWVLTGLILILAISSWYQNQSTEQLAGRALNAQERGETPRQFFEAQRVAQGFTALASTHVIFTTPSGKRITRMILFGGPDYDKERYWGYCFTGREEQNKAEGKRGKQLYDGKFFFSKGEVEAQKKRPPSNTDLIGIMRSDDLVQQQKDNLPDSDFDIFKGDETCYLMSNINLPVGLDDDGDTLNNQLERTIGSNPQSEDSDGDTISDAVEVFLMKTSPLSVDSDLDGLRDNIEDVNQNGSIELKDTNPNNPDSDHDGLCDGDGYGGRCPEGVTSPVRGEDLNQNGIVDEGETDPRKADTDANGVDDRDQRWHELQTQPLGNRPYTGNDHYPL